MVKERAKKIFIGSTIFMFICFGIGMYIQNKYGPSSKEYHYSFEEDFQGWRKDGTDLGNPKIPWWINRTDRNSTKGNYSLMFFLNNLNDAGKIWIERNFSAKKNTWYQVNITYDFGTTDYGSFNLFKILTGVFPKEFSKEKTKTGYAMPLPVQGETGGAERGKLVWLQKNYTFKTKTTDEGKIYAMVGIWGTWEGPRAYLIDNLAVSYKEIPERYYNYSSRTICMEDPESICQEELERAQFENMNCTYELIEQERPIGTCYNCLIKCK